MVHGGLPPVSFHETAPASGSHSIKRTNTYKKATAMHNHPYVSEDHEGKPWFEWIVLGVVVVATVVAAFGYTMAATVIVAVTAIITGLIRLTLREKSPWKVRSVAFDSFIGIALGIGLLITYFSFYGLLGNAIFG